MLDKNYDILSSRKKINNGAIISYISIFVGIISLLLYTPWMISKIGKSDYGIYTLALSFINIFIFDFGLSRVVSKKVSDYLIKGESDEINNVMGLFTKIYIFIAGIISIIFILIYIFIPKIYSTLTPEELIKFKNIYIYVTIYSVISFAFIPQNGVLNSHEKFVFVKVIDLMNKVLTIVLIVISLLLNKGLYSLVIGTIISGLIVILIKYFVIRFGLKIKSNIRYKNKNMMNSILNISIWGALIAFSQRFIFTITPTILGATAGAGMVAVFGIITSIEGNFYIIGSALNDLYLTNITYLINEKKEDLIEKKFYNISKFILIFTGLFLVGIIIVGESFLQLWLGSEFKEAYLGIILVLIPTFMYLPSMIPNNILLVNNKLKGQAITYLIMGIINIILVYILSTKYGVIGATIAIFISYMFRNIAMLLIYKKNININWLNYLFKIVFKIVFVLTLFTIIMKKILQNIVIDTYIKLLIISLIIGFIYMIVFAIYLIIDRKKIRKKDLK